ncbi:MAG: TlpA family protein disulfide reductase [Ekhidna sp.]
MKKTLFALLLSVTIQLSAQDVEVVKFNELQRKILYTDAPLTIFNFWATWCGPCIKELPHFDELSESNEDVKVFLVSLDFPDQLEKVKNFVTKKSLSSEVLFLNEKDPDDYMPKVSEQWTGAIPATLFVTDLGKTYFHEKEFSKEELEQTVDKYLN